MSALKVCPQCGAEYPANARFCETDGTALRAAAAGSDLIGAVIADRYHVIEKLGEGGMGQVYLVEHVKMGRKCALKVMHSGMVKDVDAISRFNREAANASRIAHANVAAVYDFGETPDGIIYLAMELVDGVPLTRVIEETGGLPPRRAAEITRQTAEALAVAHDMGIVHRDLKPDNIMVCRTREGGDLVKVVDFGIAKAAGNTAQKVTKTGSVIGTPDYMSPEQLAGDPLDNRSDVYALGLVAFNMLTGALPFPSDSAQESLIMRLTDKPKSLSELRPDIHWPPEVQRVMDKALEREAALRYQTAIEFGRDLPRAIDQMEDKRPRARTPVTGEPAPATRVAPATQVAPPKRKTALPMVGGIAALLLVSAALYGPILHMNQQGLAADTIGSTPLPQNRPVTDSTPARDSTRPAPPQSGLAAAPNPVVDVDQELAAAETESKRDDQASARAALDRLAKLASLNDPQAARAGLIKYSAYLTLDDAMKACAALKDVENRSRGTSYEGKVDRLLETC